MVGSRVLKGCFIHCADEPPCSAELGIGGAPREQLTTLLLTEAVLGDPHFGTVTGGLSLQSIGAATLSPQSLTGHTSPVESVRLNTPEELIVAGSQSGSIRVWDLEAAKSRPPCLLFLRV